MVMMLLNLGVRYNERRGERVIAVGHMQQEHDIGEATADRDKTPAALAPCACAMPHKVRPLVALRIHVTSTPNSHPVCMCF